MLHRIKWHYKKTEILVDSYSNTMMYEVISDNMSVAKTFIDDFAFLKNATYDLYTNTTMHN